MKIRLFQQPVCLQWIFPTLSWKHWIATLICWTWWIKSRTLYKRQRLEVRVQTGCRSMEPKLDLSEPGPGDRATSKVASNPLMEKTSKNHTLGFKYLNFTVFTIPSKISSWKKFVRKRVTEIHHMATPPIWVSRVGKLRCEDRHLPMDHHQRLMFDSGKPPKKTGSARCELGTCFPLNLHC